MNVKFYLDLLVIFTSIKGIIMISIIIYILKYIKKQYRKNLEYMYFLNGEIPGDTNLKSKVWLRVITFWIKSYLTFILFLSLYLKYFLIVSIIAIKKLGIIILELQRLAIHIQKIITIAWAFLNEVNLFTICIIYWHMYTKQMDVYSKLIHS